MNICRSKDGFIKFNYKIQESDLWFDDKSLVLLFRLVMYAHYEDDFTSIRFNGKQRYLKRGEFSATMQELSTLVHIPIGTLRHVVERLEEDGRLSRQSDNRNTIFRICNYAKYQDVVAKPKVNDRANSRQNEWQNATEGKKKLKNIKNIGKSFPQATKYKTPAELGMPEL